MDKKRFIKNIIATVGFVCLLGVFAFADEYSTMIFLVGAILCAIIPHWLHDPQISMEEIASLTVPRPPLKQKQDRIKKQVKVEEKPIPTPAEEFDNDEIDDAIDSEDDEDENTFLGFGV